MCRSNLIKIINKKRVENDLSSFLLYTTSFSYDERMIFIMLFIEADLIIKKFKTMKRINKNALKTQLIVKRLRTATFRSAVN